MYFRAPFKTKARVRFLVKAGFQLRVGKVAWFALLGSKGRAWVGAATPVTYFQES